METIGRFPGDPQVRAGLDEIVLEPGEVDHALGPGELVVADWLARRMIATASVTGSFAEVGTSDSLAYLHTQVAHLLSDFGLEELDVAAIRSVRRELTQQISRIVFECSTPQGRRAFDGIQYLSRYGYEFENWAIFEPAAIDPERAEEIVVGDHDLLEAARRLEVMLV